MSFGAQTITFVTYTDIGEPGAFTGTEGDDWGEDEG